MAKVITKLMLCLKEITDCFFTRFSQIVEMTTGWSNMNGPQKLNSKWKENRGWGYQYGLLYVYNLIVDSGFEQLLLPRS